MRLRAGCRELGCTGKPTGRLSDWTTIELMPAIGEEALCVVTRGRDGVFRPWAQEILRSLPVEVEEESEVLSL